jgi:hypothetical protein
MASFSRIACAVQLGPVSGIPTWTPHSEQSITVSLLPLTMTVGQTIRWRHCVIRHETRRDETRRERRHREDCFEPDGFERNFQRLQCAMSECGRTKAKLHYLIPLRSGTLLLYTLSFWLFLLRRQIKWCWKSCVAQRVIICCCPPSNSLRFSATNDSLVVISVWKRVVAEDWLNLVNTKQFISIKSYMV